MAATTAIKNFSAVASRPTRHGHPVPQELVTACLDAIGVTSSGAQPSAVQSRAWQVLLVPSPPDLVAIAPTGSGKTIAFLLPAFAELLYGPDPFAPSLAPGAFSVAQLTAAVPELPPSTVDPDSAMRAAAAAAFKRASAEGIPPDEARAIARAEGKAAWREAKTALATLGSFAGSTGNTPGNTASNTAKNTVGDNAGRAANGAMGGADGGYESGGAVSAAGGMGSAAGGVGSAAAAPRVLILAPTRELCQQTAETARRISEALANRMGLGGKGGGSGGGDGVGAGGGDAVGWSRGRDGGGEGWGRGKGGHRGRGKGGQGDEGVGGSSGGGGVGGNSVGGNSVGGGVASPPCITDRFSTGCVVGGVDYRGQRAHLLSAQPRLLVATPGRLLSLCGHTPASTRMRQQAAKGAGAGKGAAVEEEEALPPACVLGSVSLLILDEADRLLEMGFEEDLGVIRSLLATADASAQPNAQGGVSCAGGGSATGGGNGLVVSFSSPHPPPAADPAPALRLWSFLLSATWNARTAQLAAACLAPGAETLIIGAADGGMQAPAVEYAGAGGRRGGAGGAAGGGEAGGLMVPASVTQRVEVLRGKGAPRLRRLVGLLREILGGEGREGGEEEEGEEEGEAGRWEEGDTDESEGEESDGGISEGEEGHEEGADATPAHRGAAASPPPAPGVAAAPAPPRVIVFTVYKKQAKELARLLSEAGLPAVALQGDMGQAARSAAVEAFRSGHAQVRPTGVHPAQPPPPPPIVLRQVLVATSTPHLYS